MASTFRPFPIKRPKVWLDALGQASSYKRLSHIMTRSRDAMKAKFFYTGIRVKDLEASVKFYTTLLGMKERGRNTATAGKGTVVELVSEETGGNTLELNYYEKGSPFDTEYEVGEGLDHLAFVVKDLNAALEEAKQAGYPTVQVMQEPGSRYAYIEDPNGIWIELCQFG